MKVLIADDHRLIIEGVKIKLAELDPMVETVVAMNLEELDRVVAEHGDQLDLARSTSPCPVPRATNT